MMEALYVISFLSSFSNMLVYAMEAPLAKYLKMGPTEYASATSLFLLFSSLTLPLWGRAVGKRSVKELMFVAELFGVLSVLSLATLTKVGFYLSNVLAGVTSGSYPAFFAYVVKVSESAERGFGRLNSASLLGSALGSLTTVFFSPFPEPLNFLLGALAATLASAVALAACKYLKPVALKRTKRGKLNKKAKLVIAFEAMLGLGAAAGVWNFDYYLVLKYGTGLAGIGFLHFLEQSLQALGSYASPYLAERLGTATTYFALTVPATFMLLAITLINNFYLAYTLFVVRTALMNAANPLLQGLLARAVSEESLGSAATAAGLAWNLSAFVGKNLGGILMSIDSELPLRFTFVDYVFSLVFLALGLAGKL